MRMNQEEYLLESLLTALSENPDIRKEGEDALKILDVTAQYGVMLSHIISNPIQVPMHVRQFAAILLKQYVDVHWNTMAEKFVDPVVPDASKQTIMSLLPGLLSDDNSKIRAAVAYAISAIATWEWPDNWPALFPVVIQAVKSGDLNSLDGAIRVLDEISGEVNDDQIVQMFPVVVPEMLNILRDFAANKFTDVAIIARSIKVYQNLVVILSETPDRKMASQLVSTNLAEILIEINRNLVSPLIGDQVQEPKISCVSLLQVLCRHFSKIMAPLLRDGLMDSVLKLYNSVAEQYCKLAVQSSELVEVCLEEQSAGLADLAKELVAFMQTVLSRSVLCQVIGSHLEDVLFCALLLAQPSEESLENWEADPGLFIEEDELDYGDVSPRNDAAALIVDFFMDSKRNKTVSPISIVARAITMSDNLYGEQNKIWWKIREASLFVLSKLTDLTPAFNPEDLKQLWESFFVDSKQKPSFLVASEIATASNFFSQMPHDLFVKFLSTINSGIGPSHPTIVRIQSLKAINNFETFLKSPPEPVVTAIKAVFCELVLKVIQVELDLGQNDKGHYLLDLILQALYSLVELCGNDALLKQVESKLGPFCLALWIKHNNEIIVTEHCKCILGSLSRMPGSADAVCRRVVPTLMSIIKSPPQDDKYGAISVAIDALTELVKRTSKPQPQCLADVFFPAMQCTCGSDDTSTVQNGCDLLKSYVASYGSSLVSWVDGKGQSATVYIVQIVLKVLSPETAEMGAVVVGRLMAVVLRHLSDQLVGHLDSILKAVLSKMQQTSTLSVLMSLITIYAILINHKLPEVVQFLSSLPDPSGKSALEYVLREWVANQSGFYGNFERRTTCVALSKILEHILRTNHPLANMTVQGDMTMTGGPDGPVTRSKVRNSSYQQIALPVKIAKLLVQEYISFCDRIDPAQDDDDSGGSSSEGESDTENQVSAEDFFHGVNRAMFNDFEEEIDSDLKDDPFVSIDLKSYLSQYFSQMKQLPYYNDFESYFSPKELEVMREF